MKYFLNDSQLISRFSREIGGVFTLPDLINLFGGPLDNRFYRRIHYLEKADMLKKFIRGFYITSDCKLDVLNQKICHKSYISFETVLAKNLIIGTIPKNEVKAVKLGKKSCYAAHGLRITQLGINENLFFGLHKIDGINYADPEKALLDTLYFYIKGQKYFFDIYSDVDMTIINTSLLLHYLNQYKNPRFKKFVRNYIHENTLSR